MPLYEYECDACGHRVEIIQKFSDAPLAKCPRCGGPVHKLMSSPAIQFKGTGWYITDYAKKGGGGDGSRTDSSSAAKSDATTTKSEAQGDATTSDKTSSGKTPTESKPAKTASKD